MPCQSMWDELLPQYSADEIGRLFAKKTRIDSFQFSIPSSLTPLVSRLVNREKALVNKRSESATQKFQFSSGSKCSSQANY